MIRGTIAAAALLSACATGGPSGTQTRTGPQSYVIERGGETYALDSSGARVGRRSGFGGLGGVGGYCAMSLDVRADGSVARVKMLGSRSNQLELICRRAAYDWRLGVTRDGQAAALDGVQGAIVLTARRDPARPDTGGGYVAATTFDTQAIAALRNR